MASVIAFIKQHKKLFRFAQYVHYWLLNIGIDLRKFLAIGRFPRVLREYFILKRQNADTGSKWDLKFTMPSLYDKYEERGIASGHYFHQDLLVAQRIFQRRPVKHIDVGSSVEGFVAHVATFRFIEVFDIRPLTSKTPNIAFRQYDFMSLPEEFVNYCDSVSCLHALEHFGLGRYGDPLDINGHLRGFDGLYRILKPNGILYLSFPIGTQRIEFNAHRVFAIKTVMEWAKGRFELIGFSYVDDEGDLHENVALDATAFSSNFHLHYGCGIFEFGKI
jgi:SAM-dependent methyltransferase